MKNEKTYTAPKASVSVNLNTVTVIALESGLGYGPTPFIAEAADGSECGTGASPAEALLNLFENLGGVVN